MLKNQGVKDFRDPKVFWHNESQKWIMVLAVLDHIELWSSSDLKSWQKLSEFGKDQGVHDGVWECPDLFPLQLNAQEKKWVLLLSINPGGPNGGSGTQYFIGDFDGKYFITDANDTTVRWIDYGPDNYAGVTWLNVPNNRKIFMGWMSNWAYGQKVPTHPWRSAMTIPRELQLRRLNEKMYVSSGIVPELLKNGNVLLDSSSVDVRGAMSLPVDVQTSVIQGIFPASHFKFELSGGNQSLFISYEPDKKMFIIDRSKAGTSDFSPDFPLQISAPRVTDDAAIPVTIVTDVSSVEVFFDHGVTCMTAIYFPLKPFSAMAIHHDQGMQVKELKVIKLQPIW